MTSGPARVAPFDPGDPAFIENPYPLFDELRAHGEVHRHDGLGLLVAVSYQACSTVLRSPQLQRVWHDATPLEEFGAFNLLHRNSMLESGPPRHTRLRKLVAGAFNRGHTERLRPTVQAVADRLVDDLAAPIRHDGEADLLPMLAAPLPIEVIAELLGVPVADRALLQPWSNAIVKMYEYGLTAPRRADAERAAAEFVEYLRELVAYRRRHAGDDLITDLIATIPNDATDGGHLTEDELVGTTALLLMAGHEATVNVLGNGVLALLRNRSQWRRLRSDPSLADTCVEELIRYDSPLQLFERTAVADVEIGGVEIWAGQKVAALLGAAARDPAVFKDPDVLDVGRTPNPHLGFGAGIHYCLGAPLARVEVRAALIALTRRLPGLRLAGEPVRRAEFVIRGLTGLPVTA
ncbi:MAG TPA: cytochrome P450 [Pseudonocardiaceae bacterium]